MHVYGINTTGTNWDNQHSELHMIILFILFDQTIVLYATKYFDILRIIISFFIHKYPYKCGRHYERACFV